VLDYGSGSGRITRHIAQRLAPESGHLTCVDVSTVWMDVVKKRLKQFPNVDFKLGDIASLDIPDDAYDVVVVHFVLHHVDADVRQKNVSILSQKLKKGGS
jgi:ubiquinone/menaquinone biosynthesis C-methylase UbiE